MCTNRINQVIVAASLALSLGACVSNDTAKNEVSMKEEAVSAAHLNNDDLYEVHSEGRLYVFDDKETYHEFLTVGETSYRQTFIGSGPHGQTLVFGVKSEDKKKHYSEVAAYNLYMGALDNAQDFYGEARLEGRIYVFDGIKEMKAVRETGEAALRYTDIGSGPKGETVVYVLNSSNKKNKLEMLINEFKKRNSML